MQLIEKFIDVEIIDDILKEAAGGYGDLIAAALAHNVCVKSLQNRVVELRDLRAHGFLKRKEGALFVRFVRQLWKLRSGLKGRESQ
jgi:hypothetical protein